MAETFTFFWKHRLSQWHRAPFVICGVTFTHAEQYMMYAKALLFGDRETAGKLLAAETPREQQALGRAVRGFDESVWVLFREGIVFAGNYARFGQNPDQRELLFSTRGTTLVEASPHDRVWGIGLSADDPRARDRSRWLGLNLLGATLTRVREALLFECGRAEQRPAEPGAAPDHGP
ncbi:hypothetical protein GobsT_69760 [Gemmata obscuriglobus]|uniref:DUF1768 domain-containing protein n=1 Tax=Gemmata obscuriglobus TaxID=114 RepID=A0A2Z3HAH5_9BACT|nr:NADAR family protein [Gemmata obscuriglobus]AWM41901.1 DUF1768 domain-containing protein [Gemmata obscuriglobus]QEG32125.1 hypothetical protein GobsT_69760 [Gemmata obscuriglobus]VTS11478.1 GTP cyclohydrolase OS=Paenibacillus sp. MSt1 GN=ET33_17955 PE=4 SV=1: DUF1768 [Gemmata obscuriglobus UQM 2246]